MKLAAFFFHVKGASEYRPHGSESPVARTGATSMVSSWMENPTDKDRLLLKHQRRLPFPV